MKSILFVTLICTQASAFASTEMDTLKRIKQTSAITIGVRESAPPFAVYSDGIGRGYSIDICKDIVEGLEKKLGTKLDIKYVPVTSQNRIEFVKTGKVDMECGSTTTTREREKEVAFSYPFFISGARIAVRKGSPINDFKHMRGAIVNVVAGSSAEKLVKGLLISAATRGESFTVQSVANNEEAIQNVINGKADVFSTDDVLLASAISGAKADAQVVRVGSFISVEPYAIMTSKSDPAFLKMVDSLLAEFLTNKGQKYISKWFDSPDFRYKVNNLTANNFNYPAKSFAVP